MYMNRSSIVLHVVIKKSSFPTIVSGGSTSSERDPAPIAVTTPCVGNGVMERDSGDARHNGRIVSIEI